jgi:polar amino acid transport system substrate-binding protein
MDGFVNEVALAILDRMGVENVEPVLTDWGSLIPGLKAGRFDMITAGMYILPKRCAQVAFTEPMAELGSGLLVQQGNPMKLHSYSDLADAQDATVVSVQGYAEIDWLRDVGVSDSRIMQVQDTAAMIQSVKSGRADAGVATHFAIANLASKDAAVMQAEPFSGPDFTKGWPGYAFRQGDTESIEAWNEAQAEFIGSEAFWEIVEPYGFTKGNLPPDGLTTAELCES